MLDDPEIIEDNERLIVLDKDPLREVPVALTVGPSVKDWETDVVTEDDLEKLRSFVKEEVLVSVRDLLRVPTVRDAVSVREAAELNDFEALTLREFVGEADSSAENVGERCALVFVPDVD